MKSRTLAFVCALLLAALCLNQPLSAVASKEATTPCVTGRTAAAVGFWTWPANTQVNIYLHEPDFSEADAAAVKVAVQNWDAASVDNGSNVHFSVRGLTRAVKSSRGDMTLIRGDVYDSKVKHLAVLQAHSLNGDQLIDYALVIVDLRVKNPQVLTNVMAHELGHSLGLLDCYQCNRKSTAMGLLKNGNEPNGIEGPTACDTVGVVAAYRELLLNVRRAPSALLANKGQVDEGEEPEADDTPVVRKPR